jgi:hypothetical protein
VAAPDRTLLAGTALPSGTRRELNCHSEPNRRLLLVSRHRQHHLPELSRRISGERVWDDYSANVFDDAVHLYAWNPIRGDMGTLMQAHR